MAAKRRKAVTLKELGTRLDLSPFTISKALAGKEGVSAETRALIVRTAQELGYRWKAEGAQQQRRTIAVAIPAIYLGELAYFADLLQGAEAAGRDAGCLVAVIGIDAADMAAGVLPQVIAEADGAIYLPMLDARWLAKAISDGPPAVVVNFPHRTWQVDSVVWDAPAGTGHCVDYLVGQGCRRIGYVGTPDVAPGHRLRYIYFQEALSEHGLPVNPQDIFVPAASLAEATLASLRAQLGRGRPLPEAFVCDFETTALATLKVLAECGRSDIRVACADQLSAAALLTISIPYIEYHRDKVGQLAVGQLLRRLEQPDEPFVHLRVAVTFRPQ